MVTAGSMFPDANPTVVVADVPGDELFPDGEMETGGAFIKKVLFQMKKWKPAEHFIKKVLFQLHK